MKKALGIAAIMATAAGITLAIGQEQDKRIIELEKRCAELGSESQHKHQLVIGTFIELTEWEAPVDCFAQLDSADKECPKYPKTYTWILDHSNVAPSNMKISFRIGAGGQKTTDAVRALTTVGTRYAFCGRPNEHSHPGNPPAFKLDSTENIIQLDK